MCLSEHSEPLKAIPFKGLVTTGEKQAERNLSNALWGTLTWVQYAEPHARQL